MQHSAADIWRLVPKFLDKYKNENTRSGYALVITAYLDWVNHREINPLNIAPTQISDYVSYLGERLKPNSVNNTVGILRHWYRLLQAERMIDINHWAVQATLVDSNVQHAQAISPIVLGELSIVADSLGLRDAVLFRLFSEVGIQRQYVAKLVPGDLSKSSTDGYVLRVQGSRSRSVVRHIGSDLGMLIEELIISNGPGCPWVFPGYGSRHIQPRQINRIMQRLAPCLTPRRLRKSNLQRRVDDGEQLQAIASSALITVQTAAKHETKPHGGVEV